MTAMPKDRALGSTAALLVEGYEFISNRCRRLGSDVFETRIHLQPTICMRGRDAAELFYDSPHFRRKGAAPRRLRKTLFGEGGVQALDGAPHRHRKAMFLSLLAPERIADLVSMVESDWQARLPEWERAGRVVLHEQVSLMLTAAVHAWAGVPLAESDRARRRDQLHAMIVGGGGLGPNYLRGRLARRHSERALQQVVADVRNGSLDAAEGTALHEISWHRTHQGHLLHLHTAAVALLNVLRPAVAVDRFVTFVALALHEHPEWRRRLRHGDDQQVHGFVQEVRRRYPFFPFAAARVAQSFDWHGYRFPKGRRVLLDLYATDHDPRVWPSPAVFDPQRFADGDGDAYDLIPQGGGEHASGHRCPGEWLTIALMERATRLLVDAIEHEVPPQDLRLQRGKVPALPSSGFVITRVRARQRDRG